jgi:hypothetical protein
MEVSKVFDSLENSLEYKLDNSLSSLTQNTNNSIEETKILTSSNKEINLSGGDIIINTHEPIREESNAFLADAKRPENLYNKIVEKNNLSLTESFIEGINQGYFIIGCKKCENNLINNKNLSLKKKLYIGAGLFFGLPVMYYSFKGLYGFFNKKN